MWEQQTLLSEVAPVKASLSQARGKDSQELPDSCSNTFERYVNSVHVGLSGRTSQERSQASGGRLTASSCQRWMRSGMVWHGECWMRSFSVWPKDASVCSLLEVLEPCVARKYFLSAKACRGIISRADKKRQALTEEAQERVGEADHDSGCLNPGETQSRRVYPASGVYPTLSTRENSGQSQESVFLCQTAQTGSNGKLVKQDDVMNTLDRTNSTAVAALDFKVKPVAFLYNQGAKARSLGISEISPTLKTDHNPAVAFASNQRDEVRELEVAGALAAQPGIKQQTYICRADGQANAMTSVDMAPTLTSHAKKDPPLIYPAEDSIGEGALIQRDMSATLSTHNIQTPITGGREKRGLTVRRLTPRECERLQGFPDDYTDIPYRNKEHAPDGPRYKALGNSMAVPVMRWIGERIRTVEEAAETTG